MKNPETDTALRWVRSADTSISTNELKALSADGGNSPDLRYNRSRTIGANTEQKGALTAGPARPTCRHFRPLGSTDVTKTRLPERGGNGVHRKISCNAPPSLA